MSLNKKVINVDLDGVVYDFLGFMADWFIEKGILDEAETWETSSWEFWKDWGIPDGLYESEFRKALEYGTLWLEGDAIDGASEFLWRLHDRGYYIRIVTRRLVHGGLHSKAISNTARWLDGQNIPYWEIVFLGPNDSKGVFKADYAIDDNPNYILDQNAAGIDSYLFAAHHNLNTPWQKVKSWKEFYEKLEAVDEGRVESQKLDLQFVKAGAHRRLVTGPPARYSE